MYPFLNLDYRGVDLNLECNQHDLGCTKRFVTDRDLTGMIVKYVIALGDGHNVTDFCAVVDAHTIEMVIPSQVTASAGTYSGQLIVLSQNQVAADFESWKAQVLAGTTPVLIDETTPVTDTSTEAAQTVNLSFVFKIIVYRSVYQNGDYFEGDLTKLITKIQADNERITKEYDRLRSAIETNTGDITQLKGKASTHDSRLDSAFTNLGQIAAKANENAGHIATLQSTATAMDTRVTGLSQGVAANRTHCDSEFDRLEKIIKGSEAGDLSAWKEQVLAGSTIVMIDDTAQAAASEGGEESG
ncbi:hypothetical protein [uncultured Dubosiella sp.]|uniref:hypothetical protein n=1 Tax=uncultured Dubosiella sp. TaxID=1937011 RepID=UPI0025B3D284|nr:hypothetical protein [uncultured Dubosiella sp.]